jgi:hypothetical protein
MKSKTKFAKTVLAIRCTTELTRICAEMSLKRFPKKPGERTSERSAARYIKGLVREDLYRYGFKKEYVESIC